MDVVGSEIGQKMRSAIKAKLTELGCYVDDELPDYVMVMVANKRTRSQMEEDLQLFLGDNTVVFVNWLHQVLKKLQEVTVATPSKPETDKPKEKSKLKEKKAKDKKGKEKDKSKKSDLTKKAKKKDKANKKKEKIEKKKSKKKNKHHEMIHPNVPPLLMNMEKVSEPSITDVFAGQILKNHGVILDTPKNDVVDKKPVVNEIKRSMLPIIDPKTIASQSEPSFIDVVQSKTDPTVDIRDDQIKEMNDIEAKIAGLKQKLQEQLDSMSDDEDFLNIRTEAEELMNDFAEDVYQEISQTAPKTPPLAKKTPALQLPKPALQTPVEVPKDKPQETEVLPLIELRLPKRPIRERLGAKDANKTADPTNAPDKKADSPERFTPERVPEVRSSSKSAKSRLGDIPERKEKEEKIAAAEKSNDKPEICSRRLTSKVSVRVRPRVRAPASSLLLRAVADAHKSLLNIPPKVDKEPNKIKRGIVLPMRRSVDPQKIVIQVPQDTQDNNSDNISIGDVDIDSEDEGKPYKKPKESSKDEYIPTPLFKKFINTDYVPSRKMEDRLEKKDELNLDPIIIHNPTVGKEKDTQFIVTMEGFNPNAFLAKKLMTEGILDDEETTPVKDTSTNDKREQSKANEKENPTQEDKQDTQVNETVSRNKPKKRLSDTSEESDTQVIIKPDERVKKNPEVETAKLECPVVKKRKASPIVFDVSKRGVETAKRERNDSISSDSHVTVSTNLTTHKYDALPALAATERKTVPCRSFPLCRYGSSCAFVHPRCKFAHLCSRTNCLYEHPPAPNALASHVVPAANYKTISSATLPNMCKYYPSCSNPTCHYYHPKPCRYGKACLNKLECNFYHSDVTSKWKFAA